MKPFAPSQIGRRYGWHRPRVANLRMAPMFRAAPDAVFPVRFDLLSFQPDAFDQLQEGSCTSNSALGEARALHRLLGLPPDADFARQLHYWLERKEQGSDPGDDSGSSIAESVDVMEKYGLALETDWPYDPDHFAMTPTEAILAEAAQHKILKATNVAPDLASIKASIFAQRGVLYGFTVFPDLESDETAETGLLRMPDPGDDVLGGHANRWIGWDDEIEVFGEVGALRSRNSWNKKWGLNGDFWMPYAFFNAGYCSDLHQLNQAA